MRHRVKPLLFQAPMINALLAGNKTQTRRLLKPQPQEDIGLWMAEREPPYVVGDIIWVRETWRAPMWWDTYAPSEITRRALIRYEATGDGKYDGNAGKLRPSIFLPRWASRITLIITDVRFQRLNEIDEYDAIDEGCVFDREKGWWHVPGVDHPDPNFPILARSTAREMYAALWDVIHGSGAWLKNPWIAMLTFEVRAENVAAYLTRAA